MVLCLVKSVREGKMSCDFTYMWTLKKQMNKQNRNRPPDTENILTVARGEGAGGE